MHAILLVSHGSQSPKTKEEIIPLLKKIARHSPAKIHEYAFLELEKPSIPQGIDLCVQKGASRITVLLNFLNSGRHVDVDIPEIIEEAQQKYPHVEIHMTPPVGQHEGIVELFLDMIK